MKNEFKMMVISNAKKVKSNKKWDCMGSTNKLNQVWKLTVEGFKDESGNFILKDATKYGTIEGIICGNIFDDMTDEIFEILNSKNL
jgi:hypothetical protein